MSKPVRCPTCGCHVKVGGERTTHYYIPVQGPDVKRLVEAAREAERELLSAGYSAYHGPRKKLRAALAPFEEV